MIIERIRLLLVKNKIIKIIIGSIFLSVVLYLGIQLYDGVYPNISETSKGVVGTLLGAIVGGCFTLAGTLAINKSSQKAVNAIRRKNVIYKPLYDELMEIHNGILKENPYPRFVVFVKRPQTMIRHPQYTVWGRIKNDARLFEVPEKMKKVMDDLYKEIELYLRKRVDAAAALDRIYRIELKRISNTQIPEGANVGDELLSNVMAGIKPDNGLLMWRSTSEGIDEKETSVLWEELQKSINSDQDLKSCQEAKESWNKTEEFALELIGIYIQYITAKYEE